MSIDSPDFLSSADDLLPPPASTPSTTTGPEASFDVFYSTIFAPFITVLSPARTIAETETRKRFRMLWLGLAASIIACQLFLWLTDGPADLWGSFTVVIGVGGLIGRYFSLAPLREFQERYKKEALNRVLSNFGTFDEPVAGALSSSFLQSCLIVPIGNVQKFHDRIHGTHRGITIDIEEIRTYHRTPSGKRRRSKTIPLFIGILMTVDFHRPFHGVTVLRQERGRSRPYGAAGELETVSLEDPDFEKVFEVLSNDQVEARYLLTPDFMIRLLAFATSHRESQPLTLNLMELSHRVTRMQCSFVGSRLHLAIPTENDRFELLHEKTDAANREVAERVFNEIRDLLAVVDALKIESRR